MGEATNRRGLAGFFLALLEKPYRWGVTFRNWCFDTGLLSSFAAQIPVICVGNVHVGGSGKTPLVRHLCAELIARGKKPVVLTRGYGGSIAGPHLVKSEDKTTQVGDEALLYTRLDELPVVVSKDRVEGARYIEEYQLGDVIVLDDGFQHRYLERNLNLLLIPVASDRALQSFEEDSCLPLGELREPRFQALKRATSVLCTYYLSGTIEDARAELTSRCKRVSAALPSSLEGRLSTVLLTLDLSKLDASKSYWAFSGVARPAAFFAALQSSGITVKGQTAFADHHEFTEDELQQLKRESGDASLLCTEKDWIRLSPEYQAQCQTVPLQLSQISGPDLLETFSMSDSEKSE